MKKSVLITGVSGSIGNALAFEFARNGYNVIATYNRNKISNELKEYCATNNISFAECQLDISNPDQVENVFKKAFMQADYLDCVVCNSGISLGEKMLCDNTRDEIMEIINTNLLGTIYCNQAASKFMLTQKHGNIINISSIYGVEGGCCESVYSASKAGVIGLTKALAQELIDANIRVNAIAPGYVETNMTSHLTAEEKEEIKKAGQLTINKPEDIAKAVLDIAEGKKTGEIVLI